MRLFARRRLWVRVPYSPLFDVFNELLVLMEIRLPSKQEVMGSSPIQLAIIILQNRNKFYIIINITIFKKDLNYFDTKQI